MILSIGCIGKNRNMARKIGLEKASRIKFTGIIISDNDLDLYDLLVTKRR